MTHHRKRAKMSVAKKTPNNMLLGFVRQLEAALEYSNEEEPSITRRLHDALELVLSEDSSNDDSEADEDESDESGDAIEGFDGQHDDVLPHTQRGPSLEPRDEGPGTSPPERRPRTPLYQERGRRR